MIKIIKGVYGRKRYDSNSGVISLTPEEEARLIKIGVAVGVAVEETATADGAGEPTDGAGKTAADKQKRGRKKKEGAQK